MSQVTRQTFVPVGHKRNKESSDGWRDTSVRIGSLSLSNKDLATGKGRSL